MEPQSIAVTPWLHPPSYHYSLLLVRSLFFYFIDVMLTHYILIHLNGKPFNCVPNLLLKDLLVYLDINLNSIIVEYNNKIVENTLLTQIVLRHGDKVEVLTIVGGG